MRAPSSVPVLFPPSISLLCLDPQRRLTLPAHLSALLRWVSVVFSAPLSQYLLFHSSSIHLPPPSLILTSAHFTFPPVSLIASVRFWLPVHLYRFLNPFSLFISLPVYLTNQSQYLLINNAHPFLNPPYLPFFHYTSFLTPIFLPPFHLP